MVPTFISALNAILLVCIPELVMGNVLIFQVVNTEEGCWDSHLNCPRSLRILVKSLPDNTSIRGLAAGTLVQLQLIFNLKHYKNDK